MKNTKPLQNLKILITRPAHQAKSLSDAIMKLGGEPILFPTIEIADPLDKTSLQTIMQQLEKFDIAIFTSANAVIKTVPLWPKKKFSLTIAAMGPATARALEKNDLAVTVMAKTKFNSEALLDHLTLQQLANKKVVIFTGEGGRNLLSEALTRRGAQVTKVITYRRVKPKVDIAQHLPVWQQHGIDIIVSTSGEGLQNFIEMFGKKNHTWLLSKALVIISERMQALAKTLGFTKILLAENATDIAILATIKKWYSKNHVI